MIISSTRLWAKPLTDGEGQTRDQVAAAYHSREDKQANILAPVESQCEWLREIGFDDVDCYFRIFELAVFGGRAATDIGPPTKSSTRISHRNEGHWSIGQHRRNAEGVLEKHRSRVVLTGPVRGRIVGRRTAESHRQNLRSFGSIFGPIEWSRDLRDREAPFAEGRMTNGCNNSYFGW